MNQMLVHERIAKKEPAECLAKKQIPTVQQLQSSAWRAFMTELNAFARDVGLDEYSATSRIWEYPWIWFHLKEYKNKGLRVLDIGTQKSPFPWYLAGKGFDVTVSDVMDYCKQRWDDANTRSGINVKQQILNAQYLELPPESVDVCLNVSVLEHIPNKERVLQEAARVLKPGGLLVITFDAMHDGYGMKYPQKFDRAVSLEEFDNYIEASPYFEHDISRQPWNVEDIEEYLKWHRTTSHYHNYATGACILRRNNVRWKEHVFRGPQVAMGICLDTLRFKTIDSARTIWRFFKNKWKKQTSTTRF